MEFPNLPSGDPLPLAYRWVRSHGLTGLTPWHFYDDESTAQAWRATYRKETRKDAWPFASHQGRKEVAAFAVRYGKTNGKVVVIDTDVFDTMGGKAYGTIETHSSFFAWFKAAVLETEEWMTEEDLADMFDE